ncbi:glycosyltransferase [Candidatus Uhrbacteria bacterium]|nr:glycosyltransferase [Candidatus Uhrbacteria bacterium]
MKILLLSNLFPPFVRGGAERIAELQAKLLARAGHEVVVLSTTPSGAMPETRMESGLTVRRFRPRNLYHTLHDAGQPFWKRMLWHARDTFGRFPAALVVSAIKTEQPDLIVTHNMKGFGLQAFRAIQSSGIPHVHVLHDLQLLVPSGLKIWGAEHHWQTESFFQGRYMATTRSLIGNPALVVSPSRYLLDEHRAAGFFPDSQTAVVQNPVSWDPTLVADESGGETKEPVVLCVSQLEPHKGLRTLLEAWPHVQGARLAVAGDGSLVKEVAAFVGSCASVEVLGRLSPAKVHARMQHARVVVVPSLCYENTPNVILESLSVGTPVVASRIGGIPELLEVGDGELVTPGNAEELAQKINVVLTRPNAREEIKTRAERFSADLYRERFLHLLSTI